MSFDSVMVLAYFTIFILIYYHQRYAIVCVAEGTFCFLLCMKGSVQCSSLNGGCAGGSGGVGWLNSCYPKHMWSGTYSSGSDYYDWHLDAGVWRQQVIVSTYAFSVRCFRI